MKTEEKTTSKTFRLSEKTAENLNTIIEQEKQRGNIVKQDEIIGLMIENFCNQSQSRANTDQHDVNNELKEEITQLKEKLDVYKTFEDENKKFTSLITSLANLYETTPEELFTTASNFQKQVAKSTERISEQAKTIASLQEENKLLEEKLARHSETPSDGVVVNPSPIEKALLEATVAKLSERYKKEITAEEILRKIFLRYTVEQYCEWFYPFVMKDRDIEKITGKTIAELKRFFR